MYQRDYPEVKNTSESGKYIPDIKDPLSTALDKTKQNYNLDRQLNARLVQRKSGAGRQGLTEINTALKNYTEQDQRPIQEIVKQAAREGLQEIRKTG